MKWVWTILAAIVGLILLGALGLFIAGHGNNHGQNSATVEINRPAAQVFRYLTNDDLVMKWVSGLEEIRHLTPGESGAGARFYLVETYKNERVQMEMTITSFEPNRRIGFRIISLGDPSNGFIETGGYELAEQNGRTRLTLSGQSKYTGFLPRLFEPLITPAAQKKLEGDLARLKTLVEAEPAMPGTATP